MPNPVAASEGEGSDFSESREEAMLRQLMAYRDFIRAAGSEPKR